ncbi:unnamed protein product [Adineta steineri]|uniref:Rab11 family-interacting protein 1 n=1 Tax=Adineta steineri TaxID=433720 RepID=A0A816AJW5_9BILA|nr:unnamed protein product [Adineta steineri]
MSRTLSQPNYCSCTVHQARNLPDKGKSNGIDAFCTISMGKEKFVTAVREKTRAPEWQEQCDMAIPDDATIKLTVYHNTKNALSKGDFVGRTYVSLRDLQDYDRVHRSWYKLTNKDGKADKERGEIDVSLQFFSKNDTTGSVLDLATKKKHLSLKDIKHSLGSKLTIASKQKKQDNYTGDNQLAHQRHRLGGGDDSTFNVRDFLDDSASESQYSDNFIWDTSSSIREEDEESTSFAGSHMSLNSMSYNNHVEPQQKKMPRAPSSGLGSILGTGTPHSSRRSITSDYDTSSILDSASMYGGDEPSTPSPPVRSQVQQQQQQQRETHVDNGLPPRSNSMRRKSKEPSSSTTLPTVVTTKLTNNTPPLTENSRSFSVTGDDIEAAFDAINDYKTSTNESSINKSKEYDASPHDSLFGLSTIKEAVDTDEIIPDPSSPKQHTDEELDDIDFDNCFSTFKQQQHQQQNQTKIIEEKPIKNFTISSSVNQQSPKTQESKSVRHSKEPKRAAPIHTDEIHTPTVSVPSPKLNKTITPTVMITTEKQKETITNNLDDLNDSGDEDVDELLGKLERMSSMRSSTKRKIQPKDDIMQQSFSEQLSSENQHRPINLKYSTLQTNKKIQSRVLSFDDIDDIATPSIETDTKNILDPPVNNRFASSYTQNQSSPYANRTDRTGSTTLPDIVGEQSVKSSTKNSVSSSITSNKKQNDNGLCVLGYENVKSAAVHPKVRQELDYLDREELLHVIAYQSDLLKKRDTRLKDLESYTDSLLVKILEQCPTILQNGTLKYNSK